ncbi:MAG: RNA 2',3'-cyclic phosphodiesterase [Candidatus Methanomethyliaceae archaeon]|nr:RNA 2',3'-cyclic phosphodiesterase [Candidatus Methanomethyliaceae archaeon]MDW7971198.1 RNA 2',3'-cyclic phosphodiesterase [Nitrososphaerota archaeon]
MDLVRSFIAIEIEEDVKNRIMEFEKRLKECRSEIKPVEKENLHLTIKFLGEISIKLLDEVYEKMEEIKEEKFTIGIRGVGVFPSEKFIRVIWVGVEEGKEKILKIQKKLDESLAKVGFIKERDFVPHITVARVKSLGDRNEILNILNEFKEKDFGRSIVDRIVLKRSLLTPKGPIYSNIKEVLFK